MTMPGSDPAILLLSLCLVCCWVLAAPAAPDDTTSLNVMSGWKVGRATQYGGPKDAWSIHDGGCNYGHISPREPLGWQVAAMADVHNLYPKGVCGLCVEIRCSPMTFKDNYGKTLDRTQVCYNTSQTMVVRITDTCPCMYPANAYNNKRWCCGDMDHFDLSWIAFEAFADAKWGVIGLKWRQVPCQYKPPKPAVPAPYADQDSSYNPRAALPLRGWPEYMVGGPKDNAVVWGNAGYGPGWEDASWKTTLVPWNKARTSGMDSTPGLCGKVSNKGALALYTTNSNVWQGRTRLRFWIYVGVAGLHGLQAKVPDIVIGLSGNKGDCGKQRIWAVKPTEFVPTCQYCTDYWWMWEFWLNGFAGGNPNTPLKPGSFKGCGGNSLSDLNKISFRNDGFGGLNDKSFCMDSIQLI